MLTLNTGSGANAKVSQLQQEVDTLRTSKTDLQRELDTAKAAVTAASNSNREKELEQRYVLIWFEMNACEIVVKQLLTSYFALFQ